MSANKELISAYVFAERMGVSATIIYRRIKEGEITAIVIGKSKYIEWSKYSHLTFPKSNGTR